ncbi:unnamed protein product [Polarella glacialis]|uniref:Uncharacterized protein n=1 Tax=Polarella glacialis TaxID=89957 RepID=A0A813ED95_POLGL|nr:unnamed protein product [Polarella glacialis]
MDNCSFSWLSVSCCCCCCCCCFCCCLPLPARLGLPLLYFGSRRVFIIFLVVDCPAGLGRGVLSCYYSGCVLCSPAPFVSFALRRCVCVCVCACVCCCCRCCCFVVLVVVTGGARGSQARDAADLKQFEFPPCLCS